MLLKKDLQKLQRELSARDASRERMLRIVREATKLSDIAIIHIHRRESKKAARLIGEAERSLKLVCEALKDQPQLREHNSILVAQQELTEAKALFKLVNEDSILSFDESGISIAPYLLGLLDLIGELRRLTLNHLRHGDVQKAEKAFSHMESIYEDLSMLDHTAIIPTFRHKLDTARHIVEATRGDVVSEVRRLSLEEAIGKLHLGARQ